VEAALVLTRFIQFATAMVLGGTPLFFLYGPPPPHALWPKRLMSVCAALGGVAIVGWLMAQSALFGDGPADAVAPLKVWSVATETAVGRAALLRLALFVTAFAASRLVGSDRSSWLVSASLGGVAVGSLAWLGHGHTGDGVIGPLHLLADIAHLEAAAAWIGALVPLAVLAVRYGSSPLEAERRDVKAGLEGFSGIGPMVVAVLIASGLVNSWILVGPDHVGDLAGSPYGLALIAKLLLFVLMLGLAYANRAIFTPALAQGPDRGALRASLVAETVLGMLVLAAVAFLGVQQPPGLS
jgi:putative copper resistance protein D